MHKCIHDHFAAHAAARTEFDSIAVRKERRILTKDCDDEFRLSVA